MPVRVHMHEHTHTPSIMLKHVGALMAGLHIIIDKHCAIAAVWSHVAPGRPADSPRVTPINSAVPHQDPVLLLHHRDNGNTFWRQSCRDDPHCCFRPSLIPSRLQFMRPTTCTRTPLTDVDLIREQEFKVNGFEMHLH